MKQSSNSRFGFQRAFFLSVLPVTQYCVPWFLSLVLLKDSFNIYLYPFSFNILLVSVQFSFETHI